MNILVENEKVCNFNEWPSEVKAGGICTLCLPSGVIKNNLRTPSNLLNQLHVWRYPTYSSVLQFNPVISLIDSWKTSFVQFPALSGLCTLMRSTFVVACPL